MERILREIDHTTNSKNLNRTYTVYEKIDWIPVDDFCGLNMDKAFLKKLTPEGRCTFSF